MIEQSVAVRLPTARHAPMVHARSAGVWLWLGVAAALIAAAGNVVGLAGGGSIYAQETSAFVNQAIAQDIVNLAVVSPAIIVLALLARRGSLTAYLAWLGTMSFAVYNYVIYTLSVHVGPLFLPWVAVLGLSLYALIGGLAAVNLRAVKDRFASAPRRAAGWFLIVVAVLFSLLWLAGIVPAVVSGDVPVGARELALPSNPVHVLDLAFFLPAAGTAGVLLLRDRALAFTIAPGLLIFLGLTGLPIMLTPLIADARGDTPGWAVIAPITAITIVSFALVTRLLLTARETTHPVNDAAERRPSSRR